MAPPALQKTGKFSVFDRPGVKQTQRTSGARLTTASAGKIDQAAGEKIGGPFAVEPAPAFTAHREAVWDRAAAARAADDAARHLREDAVVAADAVEELAADGLALEDFDEAGAPEADGRPPRSFGGAPRRPGPQRAGARPASRLGPIAGRRASREVADVAGDGGRACLDVRT